MGKRYGGVNNSKRYDDIAEAEVTSEPEGFERPKPIPEQPEPRRHSPWSDFGLALVFLWVASPLLLAVVLSTTAKDFAEDHPFLVFLICASPIVLGIVLLRKILHKKGARD